MLVHLYPLLFLLLIIFVSYFLCQIYTSLTNLSDKQPWSKKEGLDTVTTVQQAVYSTTADARALYMIRLNLYFDFAGMNLVDIDYDGINQRHEVTVINRAGKQFNFMTYFNNIPAVHSSFFLQENLSNLSKSYAPFMYKTDWQSAVTNVQTLLIPYTSTDSIRNTFMLIWDNSNNRGNSLLSLYLFTSNAAQSKSVEMISVNVSQDDVSASAQNSGISSSETPIVDSSNGLPYLYSSASVVLSAILTNYSSVFKPEKTKKKIVHYYYMSTTTPATKVFPELEYITPFVYFNNSNGDVVVLHGDFYLKDSTSNSFTARNKDSWPSVATDIQLQNNIGSDDMFDGVVKTTAAKRYRRPVNSSSMYLTDMKNKVTTIYNVFIADTETSNRKLSDDGAPYSIGASLFSSTTSFTIGVANSELDRRLIYHLVSGSLSVIAVVAKRSNGSLSIEKVVIFENGINKSTELVNDAIEMTEAEYSKYQNPNALSGSTSSDSGSATSGSTSSSSNISGTGSNSSESSGSSSSSGVDNTGLSALEKKAVYDMVATLLFSKDSYYTSTGYTTKNCPGCEVPKAKEDVKDPPKTVSGALKSKIIKKIEGERNDDDKKDESDELSEEEKKKKKLKKKQEDEKDLPSYETQAQTGLMANLQDRLKALKEEREKKEKSDKEEDEKREKSLQLMKQQLEKKTTSSSSEKSSPTPASSLLPLPPNAPSPMNPRTPSTSMIVDSYLRRPPNPNYKPPMPVAFDFSKIGWQT